MGGEDSHQHQVNPKKSILIRFKMTIFKKFQVCKKLIIFKIQVLLIKD
jgi:hypothetical protein